MLFRKTFLSLMALFMSVSGTPVYAEDATEPEVAETDKKLVPETGTASVLGIKKLYAEENIASGTWGTCPWTIDANGVLTISKMHPIKRIKNCFRSNSGSFLFFMSKKDNINHS